MEAKAGSQPDPLLCRDSIRQGDEDGMATFELAQ
jgi:hypothetical protein